MQLTIDDREVGSFEIVRYTFEHVDNNPKIIIHQVRVNDADGNFIKFAKLSGVYSYLSEYDVTFKKLY
jgi:hypothetical protein